MKKKLEETLKAKEGLARKLKKTKNILKVKDRQISKSENKEKKYKGILDNVFTPGQVRILCNSNQKSAKWSAEDISRAISLRRISLKAYKFLRNSTGIPFPAMSTLRTWAQKFDIRQGVLNDALAIMKNKAEKMSEFERLTVITFNEIYILNQISINRKEEEVVWPHKTTQVMMARGLFSKWKQPVYYKFDTPVTNKVLNDVITKLFKCGYTVVATSDLGSSNQKLWKSLNIGTDKKQKCFFIHLSNNQYRIYIFQNAYNCFCS